MKKYIFLAFSILFAIKFAAAQTIIVSGTVKSAEGDLLHLAFVQDKQSKTGVYTDSLGNFSLSVLPNAIMRITCLGYRDTVFKLNGNVSLVVKLRTAVTINAAVNKPGGDVGSQQSAQQQLSDRIMFNTQVNGANNVMPYQRSSSNAPPPPARYGGAPAPAPPPVIGGNGPPVAIAPGAKGNPLFGAVANAMGTTNPMQQGNNAITQGDAIATFSQKGETQGSRLLYKEWAHGYVIDAQDSLVQSPDFLLNYDKIGGNLLLTKDRATVINIYNDKVKSFTLFDEFSQPHTFAIVPGINKTHYAEVLYDGDKYKIYKAVKTTFVKSDYTNDGVAATGNNYDEYKDDYSYYVENAKTSQVEPVTLKKKALKQAFAADEAKLNDYFKSNDGDIDDNYLIALGDYMNK